MDDEQPTICLRSYPAELRVDSDGKTTKIGGYAAVFNKLSVPLWPGGPREMIEPGAFSDVLKDDVRALLNHDSNVVLGRTASGTAKIWQDKKGLGAEIELDVEGNPWARSVASSVKRGDVDQMSFAFTVRDQRTETKDGENIRIVEKVEQLFDVSPVAFAAYPDTEIGMRDAGGWLGKLVRREVRGAIRELATEHPDLAAAPDVAPVRRLRARSLLLALRVQAPESGRS